MNEVKILTYKEEMALLKENKDKVAGPLLASMPDAWTGEDTEDD